MKFETTSLRVVNDPKVTTCSRKQYRKWITWHIMKEVDVYVLQDSINILIGRRTHIKLIKIFLIISFRNVKTSNRKLNRSVWIMSHHLQLAASLILSCCNQARSIEVSYSGFAAISSAWTGRHLAIDNYLDELNL